MASASTPERPGEPPRAVLYALFILLAIVLIAVLVVVGVYGGSNANGHVAQNKQILASLPELPGATRVRTTSSGYSDSESGPIVGYTTNVVYHAPDEMSAQDIIDFYVKEMTPEWTYELDEIPVGGDQAGTALHGNFSRGEAGVQVNTDGIFPGPGQTYELSIDHERNK